MKDNCATELKDDIAPEALRIWVVTDGRAGNEKPAQALAQGVAEAVDASARVELKRITPRAPFRVAPASVWAAVPPRAGGWPFSGLTDRGAALAPPYPDLVIGAGRKSAPIVAALRALGRGRVTAAQVLAPQMPLRRFDVVIAPAHDRLNAPNVVRTVGSLSRAVGAAPVDAVEDPRLAMIPRPRLTVLIGGPSGAAKASSEDLERWIRALSAAASAGIGVGATPSRRTPAAWTARLRAELTPLGGWVWDGTEPNPFVELVRGADALAVTADSVNMASEACAEGRPVFILPVARLSSKLVRFHEALSAGGHAQPMPDGMTPETLQAAPARPLDDLARAVAAVLQALGRAPAAG